ncbi:MAG: hypothetical protein FD169_41 [Bacillota bacterium]|nr:MAG: hypothetical protein FD169_41 [Bacillota bacterium]
MGAFCCIKTAEMVCQITSFVCRAQGIRVRKSSTCKVLLFRMPYIARVTLLDFKQVVQTSRRVGVSFTIARTF